MAEYHVEGDKKSGGYEWKLNDGSTVELRVTIKEGTDNEIQ